MQTLQRFYGPGGFVARRPDIHHSDAAARHYVRQHRAELIEAGALFLHGKEWHVDAELYVDTVLRIAQRRARRAAVAA